MKPEPLTKDKLCFGFLHPAHVCRKPTDWWFHKKDVQSAVKLLKKELIEQLGADKVIVISSTINKVFEGVIEK